MIVSRAVSRITLLALEAIQRLLSIGTLMLYMQRNIVYYTYNQHTCFEARDFDLRVRGVVWCGVVWCGVAWCGVAGCGVVSRGVGWCGVVFVRCGSRFAAGNDYRHLANSGRD
eukprot:1350711-Amorphochlora_amoeboformis.AAC.1